MRADVIGLLAAGLVIRAIRPGADGRRTGIRVTAGLLKNATYAVGAVAIPAEEWTSITIDVTDASGDRGAGRALTPSAG